MGHAGLCIGRGWDPATAAHIRSPYLRHTVSAARAADRCLDRLLRAVALALDPENAPLYELSDEFASIAATTVDRTTFGKWDAETDRALGHPGGDRAAAGVTDCCVLSTALAAADAGVHVMVAADACAGSPKRTISAPSTPWRSTAH